jgi:hypothetical protein
MGAAGRLTKAQSRQGGTACAQTTDCGPDDDGYFCQVRFL